MAIVYFMLVQLHGGFVLGLLHYLLFFGQVEAALHCLLLFGQVEAARVESLRAVSISLDSQNWRF